MKLFLNIFIFACLAGFSPVQADVVDESVHPEFFAWAKEHSKSYETEDETMMRLKIWKKNDGECVLCGVVFLIAFTSF